MTTGFTSTRQGNVSSFQILSEPLYGFPTTSKNPINLETPVR